MLKYLAICYRFCVLIIIIIIINTDFLTRININVSLTTISFLKQHLGASGPDTADVEALKLEVSELRQKCEQLTEQNNELKAKVMYMSDTRWKFIFKLNKYVYQRFQVCMDWCMLFIVACL